ncbi:MAG: 50S ribosomal protein L15 [Patescibacteria group bacterium]
MNLNSLTKITTKQKRRLGQGHGTGRVKTSGRGTKGQNARSNRALSFEGGALPLIKRLPFRRGKDRHHSYKKTPVIVNIKALELLKAGSIVDVKALVDAKIVALDDAKEYGVKILGDGKLTKAYTVKLPISKKAAEKVKKAGGSVE